MTIAIYPGSFDPITNGHVDIATRAAAIFDRLIVGVYDTPAKTLMFTTQERVHMAREALKDVPNIEVVSFSGLTVDFAREVGAKVVARGLRALSDFEVELQMAVINRQMLPGLEVVCLMSGLPYSFLSSSIVKEIAKLHGQVADMVPEGVARALRRRAQGLDNSETVPRHLGI